MSLELQIEEALWAALRSAHGIVLPTNDAKRLREKIYAVKRGNPAFADLTIRLSPADPTTEVWITKDETPQTHIELD